MLTLRSILFNLFFYAASAIIVISATPLFVLPRSGSVWAMRTWSHATMTLLRLVAGTRYEIRGRENLPTTGAALIAAKHQSMWDTIIFTAILNDPAIVMKRELLFIPYYGWFSKKVSMISIDRGSGPKAVRHLISQGKQARDDGRPIVIFPEGTRAAPGANNPYRPGVAALYAHLGLPCTPAAVNSGLFWPRRKFLRKPGTIVLEFLPPISPGLKRHDFMAELQTRIETATGALLAETGWSAAAAPEDNPH